ncbi:hypothetical protein Pelo_13818 [Pelomyxa schiedti]|nr:hypothetical protein Pelo_13818 [Pelomyxa schiedti]
MALKCGDLVFCVLVGCMAIMAAVECVSVDVGNIGYVTGPSLCCPTAYLQLTAISADERAFIDSMVGTSDQLFIELRSCVEQLFSNYCADCSERVIISGIIDANMNNIRRVGDIWSSSILAQTSLTWVPSLLPACTMEHSAPQLIGRLNAFVNYTLPLIGNVPALGKSSFTLAADFANSTLTKICQDPASVNPELSRECLQLLDQCNELRAVSQIWVFGTMINDKRLLLEERLVQASEAIYEACP